MNEIVKLAIDAYHGTVEKYSARETNEVLRKALIDLNGGSTVLDIRRIRDGKCGELFSIIEEILQNTVIEGLQGDEFFNRFVEIRNVAEGDQMEFVVEDANLFVVSVAANGTQGIRRQRITGKNVVTVPTRMHIVRIYEELNRVLSGRVDFNYLIAKVADSFRNKIQEEVQSFFANLGSNELGSVYYITATGTYDESAMLTLVEHVEAAAGGKNATIIGTKAALRNLKESIQSDGAKEELHNMGYYGKWFGTPCFAVPQRHKVGTTTFTMNDKELTVIATDDKPIKFVYEGNPLIIPKDFADNADLTMELECAA